MTDRPLFSECVVGFRYWSLRGDELFPVYRGPAWSPGVNHAVCHAATPPEHAAPHNGCECGLYAYHAIRQRPRKSRAGETLVLGATVSWGDVEVHRTGVRAEFAQIVALARADTPAAVVLPADGAVVAGAFEDAEAFLAAYGFDATDPLAPRVITPTALHPPELVASRTILLPAWNRDPRFADVIRERLDRDPAACATPATIDALRPSVERAALHYGVPAVALEDLADVASAFGAPLPDSARPPEEEEPLPTAVSARDLPIRVVPPSPAPVEPLLTPEAEAELIAKARPPYDTAMRRRRDRVLVLIGRAATPEGDDADLLAFLAHRHALPIDSREVALRARQRLRAIGALTDPPPGVAKVAARVGVDPGNGDAFVEALFPHRDDFSGGFDPGMSAGIGS